MNQLFNQTYQNKKVLVTGHTGFKGSWLSLWLLLLGAEVVGFSLEPDTDPSLYRELVLEKKLTGIIGDIRDKDLVESVINKHKPDFIFHLAAQPLVRRSYSEPHLTFETNIMGTVNILEAVRKSNLKCVIVNVTSDKCYENSGNACSFSENNPMGGYDPYSASKGAAELVTSAYRNSYFNPANYGINHKTALASARAGNVIGGGDWAEDRLIPDFVRALSKEEDIIIRNPHATRPWQHVMECVSGYLHLAAKLNENPAKYAEGWNFGPDKNSVMTVEQIIQKSLELWGTGMSSALQVGKAEPSGSSLPLRSGNYKIISDKNMKEAAFLSLDISKAKEKLGWQPVYDINQALEKTISWYKNYYFNKADSFEFTKQQIEEYCSNYAPSFP